jgi:hypothetical protein
VGTAHQGLPNDTSTVHSDLFPRICSIRLPRFLRRLFLGRRRRSFCFSRRCRMRRRLCGWRRSRLGFRFRGGFWRRRHRPSWLRMRNRWMCSRRMCSWRMCSRCCRLSTPLGRRRGRLGSRWRGLTRFPHRLSRSRRRSRRRTRRCRGGPGCRGMCRGRCRGRCRPRFRTVRLRARRRRSRGRSRPSGNHRSNWFPFGDRLGRHENSRSTLVHRRKLLVVLRRCLPLL